MSPFDVVVNVDTLTSAAVNSLKWVSKADIVVVVVAVVVVDVVLTVCVTQQPKSVAPKM